MKNKTKSKKKNLHYKNNDSQSDEEMLQVAFDVEEDLNLPENYQLDEINQQSVEFLKFVKNQRKNIEMKNENFKSIDLEFNINVNNNNIFKETYDKFAIDNFWIMAIKREFSNLQKRMAILKKEKERNTTHYKNVGDLIKEYNLYYENIKYFSIPNDTMIKELCPILSNKLCIKLINHFNKILFKSTTDEEKILTWIYFLLSFLEMPLVDEDNSVLYSLNKAILKHLIENSNDENLSTLCKESIGKKIIFVVISEIYGQKVMINL